jgi:glycosyltransferase involved in cell wall biosynthesis
MDKKKTLIIAITGNLYSDQRMQRIAGAFTESNWNVEIFFRNYFKHKRLNQTLKPTYKFNAYGIRSAFNGGVLFYLTYNLQLFTRLIFKKTDLFYAVDSDTLPAFILLKIIRRKPLVYDAHEYFSEVPELSNSPFKKWIWHTITKIGVKHSNYCITVGPALSNELEKRYGKAFVSIRNVPIQRKKELTQTNSDRVILYQGALNKDREIELLIHAMEKLPNFKCLIAGEGDLSHSLRELAKNSKNIEFLGLLSPIELAELTPKCFAGFNLLKANESLSYYYSLSNKYFDYMQAEIPSISSKLPEYLRLNDELKCGVCIDNTELEFVNLIENWESNPKEYLKLKENANFAAEKNHWELEKQKLIEYIGL